MSVSEPSWVASLRRAVQEARTDQFARFVPPPGERRHSAVLILFGSGTDGAPDVLLTERASTLRSHAGQVSFPGGRQDPRDGGPQAAALREAQEETGLDPGGVDVLGHLPPLYLPPSDYVVTPVVAWWRRPTTVAVVDAAEVARVARVPVCDLIDPANRFLVTHPSGYVGPGFRAGSWFVWGFTAGLLDGLLSAAGWDRPWDRGRFEAIVAGGAS